ncbi:dephospho-CoA kinase [Lysobacter sp. GX 14042]|uniref:dephospho-CoA kinase n=1 Tax=Lysobacter sp. GX 14042 TaxID=2907155 RepID=UPI001EEA9416|nr:dephospho-CoA kinase [Lysobacter sp. GX 14042]MCE7031189.1 dephospho-CoA kinase [Lysobacter sp. GX 14042]
MTRESPSNPHCYTVALTGGVASGKSTAANLFKALDITVADADVASREVIAPGSEGLAAVVAAFGADVLDTEGALDRTAMRKRVFTDPAARKQLESIIHPQVRAWLKSTAATAPGPYVIVDIPLLTEGGGREAYPWLGRILVVDVPVKVQRERLMQRDGVDAALADSMITAQATRDERLAIADDIIVNDGPIEALEPHVAALDRFYRTLAEA